MQVYMITIITVDFLINDYGLLYVLYWIFHLRVANSTYYNDNNRIPNGILWGPCNDLSTGFSVSLGFLLYSSDICWFLLEAIFICSLWCTVFECTIVDLSIIQKLYATYQWKLWNSHTSQLEWSWWGWL